jgi:hypothetical protein
MSSFLECSLLKRVSGIDELDSMMKLMRLPYKIWLPCRCIKFTVQLLIGLFTVTPRSMGMARSLQWFSRGSRARYPRASTKLRNSYFVLGLTSSQWLFFRLLSLPQWSFLGFWGGHIS